MRLLILALSIVIFPFASFAIEIACEHKIGKQTAFIIDGRVEVENTPYSVFYGKKFLKKNF